MIPTDHDDPPSALRLPATLLLAVLATPLAPWAWVLMSGSARWRYLRSPWVRAALVTITIAALPLVAIGVLAAAGIWPDPNPNPIGPGLLFVAGLVLGTLLVTIGILHMALTKQNP